MAKGLVLFGFLLIMLASYGCVSEEKFDFSGKSQKELMFLSKKALLSYGYVIRYEDNDLGVIQAVKIASGGTSAYLGAGKDTLTGLYTSIPSYVSELVTVTVGEEWVLIKAETSTNTIWDPSRVDGIKNAIKNRILQFEQ